MQQSEYMAMMQGDDGTLGTAELVADYEQGIADLRSAVAGMTKEQVLARPVPGKWSTLECVGHLADTEIAFGWGFNDAAHFSRIFRARFGCSARELRASVSASS